jgi:ATP-dependent helicase/nuclease subunit B
MATHPRVFTIPASAPFLPALLKALMEDRLGLGFRPDSDPLTLAQATLYLPTRRACRLAREKFLEVLDRDVAILPRIVAIGDVDEDEIVFADAATGEIGGAALDLPKEFGGLERKVLLAQLILRWAQTPAMTSDGKVSLVANSPAAALALAGDLARLMDDMVMRQVPWDRLDKLVPNDLDEFWQKTLEFLRIVSTQWRAHLKEKNRIEPAERRNRLIAAEAEQLANSAGPVIAAGSTGSIPATATLLATIAKLPRGALVLPGLDTDLDAETWTLIASPDGKSEPTHGHPQFAMHALLHRIGIERAAVTLLAQPEPHGRELICSEALRPAAATELWQQRLHDPGFSAHADAALKTISVIEAANAEEEALAVAVTLREAMGVPGKTAALVTPDRALARRVLAALARWNVPVDDSSGDSLADTPAGVFARLAAEAALDGLDPVTLLALLKHPSCKTLDRYATEILERAILRGPRPKRGTAGLSHALTSFRAELARFRRKEESSLHRSDPRTVIGDAELDAAAALVAQLAKALAPLETLPQQPQAFTAIAGRHWDVIAALGGATRELADAFEEIAAAGPLDVLPADYPELFHAAIADRKVRRPEADVRVRIYGTVDARLVSVDRLVLGGLVEGVWPPETRADPWLSRPMRHELKLDLPERRIGLSAHDFAQALGAPEVILTRAAKLGGTPTVASRFVQRLAAVAGEARWQTALGRGANYINLARALDSPVGVPTPAVRPRPKPPLAARPIALSVTEIEHWLRDPYTIYAKHILKLVPLEAIDTPPGVADRGTVIHGAIGDFTRLYAATLPPDPAAELLKLGRKHFAPLDDYEEARAFWWPRFERIARWFVETFEPERRARLDAMQAEIRGELAIPLGNRIFTLSTRADRIERLADGSFAILDYKTGQPPSEKQVRTGLSPQLTLEAAILRGGGFHDIAAGASVRELVYVALRGGNPPGEAQAIDFKDGNADAQADRALARLTGVAARFFDEATPYLSLVHPMWKTHAANERCPKYPAGGARPPDRGLRSGRLGVGCGQRRLRQDPCAGAARDPAAAARSRPVSNSLHHLHQGRRRQHGQPRVRPVTRMDGARRRRAR